MFFAIEQILTRKEHSSTHLTQQERNDWRELIFALREWYFVCSTKHVSHRKQRHTRRSAKDWTQYSRLYNESLSLTSILTLN